MLSPMPLKPLSDTPLVSVIVANYNYGRFMETAVESLVAQSYENWELLICDDGSTDESLEVLPILEASDDRIRVFYKKNGGQASAWNRAFEHAKGEIICLLDPDDQFFSDKLSTIVETFRKNEYVGLIYHQNLAITTTGSILRPPYPPVLERGWMLGRALQSGGRGPDVATTQLCLRATFADLAFPVPDVFKPGFGDAYLIGIAQFCTEIIGLDVPLSYQVFHGENHSALIEAGQGGIVSPVRAAGVYRDPSKISAIVHYSIVIFDEIQAFVERNFGRELASQLQLNDVPNLSDQIAALYVVSGRPTAGVGGLSERQMLDNFSGSRRRYFWRVLFTLPDFISQRLLQVWFSEAWWKRLARPVAGALGLRAKPRSAT